MEKKKKKRRKNSAGRSWKLISLFCIADDAIQFTIPFVYKATHCEYLSSSLIF